MGNFYTNYTLRGPSQQSVAAVLAGRSAIVTPARAGCVVVFDEESDDQNQEVIAELAARLSRTLRCPLLAVLNHDDSVFWYQLYLNGELMDEYNSSPHYFDAADEEEATSAPEGGDVSKICEAFGVGMTGDIGNILKKSSLDEDGYVFAVERHADLAEALGISSFGVGVCFRSFSDGELPEDMPEKDSIRTKDLIVTSLGAQLPEAMGPKPAPGYYKVSFRVHPQLKNSIPTSWMPNLWADLECPEQSLSDQFQKAVAPYRGIFKSLGFIEQGFKKLTRVLNPNARDMGGINCLGGNQSYFGQIIYNRSYLLAQQSEKEVVVVSFTAVFQDETFSCTNHHDFFEPIPNHNVVRLKSNDAGFIYEQFVQHLKQRTDSPRQFQDLPALQAWFDASALHVFEYRVRCGAFVRMSEYEVEVARRKL